jgi:antitoxin component YwqK of YwqJK toxin-antitoxin module
MKRLILVLFLLITGIFVVSAQEEVNQFNKNGERTGTWVKYYDNGNVRYQGQFENGKEVGVFKFYSIKSNSHPIIIKTFLKNTNIAKVSFYTTEGVLESTGDMDGELRSGLWVFYHSDGTTIIAEENYKNGLLEGESKTYYKDGKITEIMHYKNGKLDGSYKRFSDEAILLDDLMYTDGNLNGLAKYYNTKGTLILTGTYSDNEKVGKWSNYNNGEEVKPSEMKQ